MTQDKATFIYIIYILGQLQYHRRRRADVRRGLRADGLQYTHTHTQTRSLSLSLTHSTFHFTIDSRYNMQKTLKAFVL